MIAVINAVFGTATAWVLVRYRFPGKALLSALVDLPFAIPTLVAGIMLAVLYGPGTLARHARSTRTASPIIFAQPGIVLALLFVTLPFVIRAVEPVLLEIDPAEEEAALVLGASAVARVPHGVSAGDHAGRAVVGDPLARPRAGRVRRAGRGRRQHPDAHADRAGLRVRRDRERRAARRGGAVDRAARRSRSACTRSRCYIERNTGARHG